MKKAARVFDVIAIAFTIIFFTYSALIGGDAFNGIDAPGLAENYVSGGYYVASHGIYSQVSHTQWILSLIITSIFWLSLIVALVVNVIAIFKKQPNAESQHV